MNIVNYQEFMKIKAEFFKKHDDWSVDTSPMDEYGAYSKSYICTDGARWIENMRPVWEKVTVEVKGVKIPVSVKLFETEAYNTDNADSVFYYEKFYHEKEAEI